MMWALAHPEPDDATRAVLRGHRRGDDLHQTVEYIQGIQGEQGPPGTGLGTREQHVSDSSIAHAHSTRTAVAACPEGSIVVSGGWEELDDVNDLDVAQSRPDLPAEVWVVTMVNHTDQDQTFRAVAMRAVTS
jgi:hypothetical protein